MGGRNVLTGPACAWFPYGYMKTGYLLLTIFTAGIAGCPRGEEALRPDLENTPAPVVTPGAPGGASGIEPVARPTFDARMPAPCESHTACYLAAKDAHASGKRAGYLLALRDCEYYRGRYQLEKFYGMCLFILADAYRHLDNFTEAKNCYRRFLDTQPDDHELALQAREGMDEVEAGKREPVLYKRYLEAVSLLVRFNTESDEQLVFRARRILEDIQKKKPDWDLDEKVRYLLEQIAGLDKERKADHAPETVQAQ